MYFPLHKEIYTPYFRCLKTVTIEIQCLCEMVLFESLSKLFGGYPSDYRSSKTILELSDPCG